MARRVRDIFEISDYTSLDVLIARLQALRATLDEQASPLVAVRGDDFFGQRLTITYLRELTREEAAIEQKYAPERSRGAPAQSKEDNNLERPH